MMRYDFHALPLNEKLYWLEYKGEAVLTIRYYGYKITLHLLEGHYLEVFFHHKTASIVKISPLMPGCSRMKFYADQLKLKGSWHCICRSAH